MTTHQIYRVLGYLTDKINTIRKIKSKHRQKCFMFYKYQNI